MSNHKICSDLKTECYKTQSPKHNKTARHRQSPVRPHTLQMAVFQQNNANTQKYEIKNVHPYSETPALIAAARSLPAPAVSPPFCRQRHFRANFRTEHAYLLRSDRNIRRKQNTPHQHLSHYRRSDSSPHSLPWSSTTKADRYCIRKTPTGLCPSPPFPN